ncbi:Transcription factor, GATA, plant [Cynara cardunculus var. scolymus]|uniref:GATA transcription factor n=2 Tax=Cynara cardunculus var. scolymus TaxID=59895 RepID=A0A103YGR1_CYNCS|nr:Transcription factor, GATA, plant [Cynara cardunculus var. scolymus]
MDCLQSQSKPTFKFNHLPPSFSDDFLPLNADDFFVDGLLDFSTDAAFVQDDDNSQLLKHPDDTNNQKPSSVSPIKTDNHDRTTVPETELCLPVDDVADLEWVSQFVDDSFSGGYLLTCAEGKLPERKLETETVTLVAVNPSFKSMVYKKARSKRSRTGGRVWSLRSSTPLTDSSASSSSSSSCTSKPLLALEEILGKAPVKRQKKKKPAAMVETTGSGQPQPRRCSHCLVQKTPQWRAGPLGAKTLCNACGVRYKSGRLLPEYRPACSPTFSSEVHSNNHRKVLEMRRKKEEAVDGGVSLPVQSS